MGCAQGRMVDTARNCIHVSAEELQICWGDNPDYWEMVPNYDTGSLKRIAVLKQVCWFDVKGELVWSPPPGTYTVSWTAKLSASAGGWESDAVNFTFSKKKRNDTVEEISRCTCYLNGPRSASPEPTIRDLGNGWKEYDVGDFAVKAGERNLALEFAMVATTDKWKTGLALDGIVIRPKSSVDVTAPLQRERSIARVPDAAGDPSNTLVDVPAPLRLESSRARVPDAAGGPSNINYGGTNTNYSGPANISYGHNINFNFKLSIPRLWGQ